MKKVLRKGTRKKSGKSPRKGRPRKKSVFEQIGNQRLLTNVKQLNDFIPYQYLKMDGMHCLK